MLDRLRSLVRDIPDYPAEGIVFRDITPLLRDPAGLSLAVELMVNPYRDMKIDLVVGAESRGFIFGTALARALNAGFVPIRKKGKLPGDTVSQEYDLEYGHDTLEIHVDAIHPGQQVLMVDDLIATGGTLEAGVKLIEKFGGELVGITVLIELQGLDGAKRVAPHPVHAVLRY
ncbi:MAG: adenine phosphoribosyltransferase [Planctomycetota bacterium]|nr:adenine phosphoribosyltransferase [Planctomycetota bacterium]